jgi:hypothetical protein
MSPLFIRLGSEFSLLLALFESLKKRKLSAVYSRPAMSSQELMTSAGSGRRRGGLGSDQRDDLDSEKKEPRVNREGGVVGEGWVNSSSWLSRLEDTQPMSLFLVFELLQWPTEFENQRARDKRLRFKGRLFGNGI